MPIDPGSYDLSSLLSILNDKPQSSFTSVSNEVTIDLMCKLLSRDDYVGFAEKLSQPSDRLNLLEFILHVLRDRCLLNTDPTIDINRRARRLMFKIISKTPVVPRSFIVTGVSVPGKREHIGRGGFGNVYKGELRGTVVALKVLYKQDTSNLAFCREALMWGSLKHKFVPPFIGINEYEDGTTFLVSPYMKNGTLAQWRKNANPSIAQIEERMLEVAQGMEYIHWEGVVHGDLRGENILLDAAIHVQIADFGLTRVLDSTNTRSGAKHLNFAAPELFGCLEDPNDSSVDDPARTQMSDVYAFGSLYYEIHYDNMPFVGRRDIQIMALVTQGKRPPRLADPPLVDDTWELIQQCWMPEPSKRPKMKDVTKRMMAISQSVAMLQKISSLSLTMRHSSLLSSGDTLLSLLSMLNDKTGSSPTPVVNVTTVELMRKLLSQENYLSMVEDLVETSDVKILMDFLLYLLHNRLLLNLERRARRLMIKATSKIPVIPPSLIVTGVITSSVRDFTALGRFSVVIRGELKGVAVALKVFTSSSVAAFCREALMWKFLNHNLVLPFFGIYIESRSLSFLVSPYMQNGNLSNWRRYTNPSAAEIRNHMIEVAKGMEYIHSEGVVHGGLHGTNILLANFRIQIAGFSSAMLAEDPITGFEYEYAHFTAPELFKNIENNDKNDPRTQMSDVYAFGCLYYEIHYDRVPFADVERSRILHLVSQGVRPPRLDEPPLDDGIWDLIQRCWASEPSERPRMEDIRQSMVLSYSM